MKSAKAIAYSLLETLVKNHPEECYISADQAIESNSKREIIFPITNRTAGSADYLIWAAVKLYLEGEYWEIDKQHRWIGFIQKGVIDLADPDAFDGLDLERDRVRNAPDNQSGWVLSPTETEK